MQYVGPGRDSLMAGVLRHAGLDGIMTGVVNVMRIGYRSAVAVYGEWELPLGHKYSRVEATT